MKTEVLRLKLDPRIAPTGKRVDKLQLAPGDQVAYVGKVEVNGVTSHDVDLFTLTNRLGYVSVEEINNSEIAIMQHHLVNSMEELAENFLDVISKRATEALRGILHAEFGEIPKWKLEVVMPHFQNIVRHSIWEEMGSPEPTHKKPKWWRRVYFSIKRTLRKEEFDESPFGED